MPRTVFLNPYISHLETLCAVLFSLGFFCFPFSTLSLTFSLFAVLLSFGFPSCVNPQQFGLQLKLIQAWKGSDDFSWKNCIFFVYFFKPCYYPVACFTVLILRNLCILVSGSTVVHFNILLCNVIGKKYIYSYHDDIMGCT